MAVFQEKKTKKLDRIAEESGVAVVVLDRQARVVSASNNNSICAELYDRPVVGDKCKEYCGKAFENAFRERKPVDFECHAGLTCRAMPVQHDGVPFIAIIGRTFTKSANYRKATENAVNGEWRSIPPTKFFDNILISGSSESINDVAAKLSKFIISDDIKLPEPVRSVKPTLAAKVGSKKKTSETSSGKRSESESISRLIEKFNQERDLIPGPAQPSFDRPAVSPFKIDSETPLPQTRITEPIRQVEPRVTVEEEEKPVRSRQSGLISEWRSAMGSLMTRTYHEACSVVLDFLASRYGFNSLIWLEQKDGIFEGIAAKGLLTGKAVHIDLRSDNDRLIKAAEERKPIELKEKQDPTKPQRRTLSIFPIMVGAEIRAAIGIELGKPINAEAEEVSRFAASIGSQIEILRLRHEMSSRDRLARGIRRFSESLRTVDHEDFWMEVTRSIGELLRAERVSLLVADPSNGQLKPKASIGSPADLDVLKDLGAKVAMKAMTGGTPLLVKDIRRSNFAASPAEWRYKSGSFISFPVTIGKRRLAVINLTDKAGGGEFTEQDLELLEGIVPQVGVAIDRGSLKVRAGELEKRSITDSLTGLMNRGYIEERLIEEMNQAGRHRFQMTLMMIDVDNFKSYNDSFGHPAGDVALQRVANALKETLRAADVAARYGGEEFSILLPQTGLEEALSIAERLRQRVERTEFPGRQVTISVGVASYSNEFADPKDWVTAADMALYEAKEMGRNNVQVYEKLGRSFREKIH